MIRAQYLLAESQDSGAIAIRSILVATFAEDVAYVCTEVRVGKSAGASGHRTVIKAMLYELLGCAIAAAFNEVPAVASYEHHSDVAMRLFMALIRCT
jgi:hypothetical protein